MHDCGVAGGAGKPMMLSHSMPFLNLDTLALALLLMYTLDKGWKLACIVRFFQRQEPTALETWPKVSLIQPITRGASGLAHNLNTRAMLAYPGKVQHLLVCDGADDETVHVCRAWLETWPGLEAQLVCLEEKQADRETGRQEDRRGDEETGRQGGRELEASGLSTLNSQLSNQSPRPASKVEKMQAGVAQANGDIFCFIDDDVAPRPDNLTVFVNHLHAERAGGVFGLACYTNWDAVGSSLMSLFVNANALPSYIPLTYLCEPYTITGHFFALRRDEFAHSGGLDNMEILLADDHEIAKRVRALGLRIVQTPAIYDVNNELPTVGAFHRQIRRWFVFSGRLLWPLMTNYERLVSSVFSVASLIPACLLFFALIRPSETTIVSLLVALLVAAMGYAVCETGYLARRTPQRRWHLLLWVTLFTPWQALGTLLCGSEVIWRGQRIRVHKDGTYEALP